MTRLFSIFAFTLGALVVAWCGSAFVGSHPLALGVTLAIAAGYGIGLVELLRFQSDSRALQQTLQKLSAPPADLSAWLLSLPAGLRDSVRARLDGHSGSLPGPVLTPYLTALLVMLGLLGTFVGLVATLKGAVGALEGSTELEAVRAGLAAPIQGLGTAFGTSVAGITASAMLGLIATLSRRQRLQAGALLERTITTGLREFSADHQRQQAYRTLQQQADGLPLLNQNLAAVGDQLQRMGEQLASQLLDNQTRFLESASHSYIQLASSVDTSLRQSLSDSGERVSAALEPQVRQLSTHLQQQNQASGEQIGARLDSHLQGLEQLLREHLQQLRDSTRTDIGAVTATLGSGLQGLSDNLGNGLQGLSDNLKTELGGVRDGLQAELQALSGQMKTELGGVSGGLHTELQALSSHLKTELGGVSGGLHTELQALSSHLKAGLEGVNGDLQTQLQALSGHLHTDLSDLRHDLGDNLDGVQNGLKDGLQQLSGGIQTELRGTAGDLREALQQLTGELRDQLVALHQQEEARGQTTAEQLNALQTHAGEQIVALGRALKGPLGQILDSAREGPRVAADILSTLREEAAELGRRDQQLLQDRQALLQDMGQLSEQLQQASASHSQTADEVLSGSARMLEQLRDQVATNVASNLEALQNSSEQLSAGALEVSSLAEAFSAAVGQFGDASQGLSQCLTSIETSLQESASRNDEQLAYYVAQAREIIDHSMLSQQDILTQLQQLPRADQPVSAEEDA